MKTSKIKSKPDSTAGQPKSGSLHSACSPIVPSSLIVQMWRCWFQRPRQWRLARAASRLTAHAWNTGDSDLWWQLDQLQNKLWAEVYAEENA